MLDNYSKNKNLKIHVLCNNIHMALIKRIEKSVNFVVQRDPWEDSPKLILICSCGLLLYISMPFSLVLQDFRSFVRSHFFAL